MAIPRRWQILRQTITLSGPVSANALARLSRCALCAAVFFYCADGAEGYLMSFMQLELYADRAYIIDGPMGRDIIPMSIIGPIEGLDIGEIDDDSPAWPEACAALRDYVDGDISEAYSIELTRPGYVGRYQAPGYMDCTPWQYGEDEEALNEMLREAYAD